MTIDPELLSKLGTKCHIGDGVYAHHDSYQIWLSTNASPAGIALEPAVMRQLKVYEDYIALLVAEHSLQAPL